MLNKELTPREQLDEYLKCLPNSANQLKWNNNLPGSDILNYKDIGILLTEQLEPQFYLNLGAVSHFDAQDAMLLGIPDGYAGDFLTVLTLVPSVNHSPGSIIQFAYGPGTTYTRFDNGLEGWNDWTAMSGGTITPNPNMGIRTVNGRSPDQSGNVETDFRVIDVIRADVPWTEYAEGKTEFLTEFKISEYPRSRNSSVPGLELLPDGEIIVRTVTDPHKTVCYQTVDTVVDGVFQGSFARLGNSDGTWGPLTAKESNKGEKGDKGDPGERGPAGATGATGAAGPKGDTGPAGAVGPTGPQGPIGQTGLSGQTGPRGPQGEKGDMGDGFTITAIYKTVAEMHADIGNPEIPVGAFVIISSDNPDTDPDNSKVFVKTPTEYRFQSVLRGLKGETGDRGLQGVQGTQGIPGNNGVDGAKGDKGDVGATGSTGPKGDPGDPLQIVDNLFSEDEEKALSARQGNILSQMIYGVEDELGEHIPKIASTTELGHVKIDGTSVKMHENNQLYVDIGDLPIPIQINNEYVISDSPTTYPVGHTITMLGPDDPGFADLISEFNLDYDIELTSLNTRFIVQTVKNKNNMTHQTAQAITNSRGSVLGTMYRFSQSSYYGFSSWYSQTHVLTGRGAPGDQGRGEGIAGNLYVNSITGRVHAKAGYDKTVGYTNWRLVGPAVVNNAFEPEEDDDEHVYSAYTVEQMFEGAKNNLKNNVKLNRIWESDPITANATTWTVDFSDEPELTDLNNYDFEIYDDGVLIFGNPITHVVNNENKTVTFTPQRPMPRAFTLTCVGRGMEYR